MQERDSPSILPFEKIQLNRKAYVKNFMAGWADKKPPGDITLIFKHGVKTIFVSTRRTDFKLVFHLNIFDLVIHKTRNAAIIMYLNCPKAVLDFFERLR